MITSIEATTGWLEKGAWFAWTLLVGTLIGVLFNDGMAPPAAALPFKYPVISITTLVMIWTALVTTAITQARYGIKGMMHGETIDRIARWIAMSGWTILGLRFTWIMWLFGYIPTHPLALSGVCLLAIAAWLRNVVVWFEYEYEHKIPA